MAKEWYVEARINTTGSCTSVQVYAQTESVAMEVAKGKLSSSYSCSTSDVVITSIRER